MIDQTSYAARQTLLAIKCSRLSMILNMALLILFCFLLAFGILRQPAYVATTSDIFPSLIHPARESELYGISFRMDERERMLKDETESVRITQEGKRLLDHVTKDMPPAYGKNEIIPRGDR